MAFVKFKDSFYDPATQPTDGSGTLKTRVEIDKDLGKVRVFQYVKKTDNTVTDELLIYEDGVFNGKGAITTDDERQKFHNEIITSIKGNTNIKTKPQFVTENSKYTVLGQNATPTVPTNPFELLEKLAGVALPLAQLPGIIENLASLLKIDITADFTSANMEKMFNAGVSLRYPIDISPSQDRLKIIQYEYSSPYTDAFKTPTQNLLSTGIQRGSALKKQLATLYLPMPNNVTDQNNTNWGSGGESMKSIDIAAAGNVPVATKYAVGSAVGGLANELTKIIPVGEAMKILAAAEISGGITNIYNNPVMIAALQAAVLKVAGFDVPADTILSRGYGVVPNSNLELLFSGPTIRTFSFTYRMSPRDEDEALEIKKILRYFKQGMAAKKANSKNGAGGSSFLLSTPNVFKLQYITAGESPISGLNRFKICALTGMNASYSPDGQWAAYDKGQPASMVMSLKFSELEPVYESDYQESIFKGPGKNFEANYEKINSDPKSKDFDIGY